MEGVPAGTSTAGPQSPAVHAREGGFEEVRIDGLEDTVEGVVAGNAAGQFGEGEQPVFVIEGEVLHVSEGGVSAQRGAYGDDEDVSEQVLGFAAVAGIGHAGESVEQADEDE